MNNTLEPVSSHEDLAGSKVVSPEGFPIKMYNRSKVDFSVFELGKRNVSKTGVNKFGFFFTDRPDAVHYGPFVKERYLNIQNPLDIRDIGHRSTYRIFRNRLVDLGFSEKELAGYDLAFQNHYQDRNRRAGSTFGLHNEWGTNMFDTDMATFNFFDANEGFYLRKLLVSKGYDGVFFDDEGSLTAVAFDPEQIIEP